MPTQAGESKLLVLGDSISAAYGIRLEEGWVSKLQESLAITRPEVRVINASISGETSDGVVRRLPALLASHRPNWVVVEIGGNDGLRGFPISRLGKNLDTIIVLSKQSSAEVLLLGMKIPPNYGRKYTESFSSLYPQLADKYSIPHVPFFLEGVAGHPERMQADGIHPTLESQAILLQNVLPDIKALINDSALHGSDTQQLEQQIGK